MKFQKLFLAFLAVLFLSASPAFAGFVGLEDGTQEGIIEKLNVSTGLDLSVEGKTGTVIADSTVLKTGAAVAITAGTTPTITVSAGKSLFTYTVGTDNQDSTFGVSGVGTAGDEMTIIFITDAAGSADEVMTFGTNIRSTGTLTLANAASSRYLVTFISDGTKWNERSRTAVQAA